MKNHFALRDIDKGFSILEVVVAVAIFSIGLLGIGTLMVGSIHANNTSWDMAVATTLAQEKMETIKQQAYLGAGHAGHISAEPYGSIPDFPSFQRIVSVSSISGVSGIRDVTVTVSWKYLYTHSVELKTLLLR